MSEENENGSLWWIRWGEHSEVSVPTPSVVESKLNSLWAQFRGGDGRLVEIEAPEGTCLTIVAGRDVTYLNYVPQDGVSSCTSVGDRSGGEFFYRDWGSLVNVDGRHVVEESAGREALHQFLTTGGSVLPDAIEWEEV